jgi:hypothetical protein
MYSDLYANCSPVPADLVLNPVLRGDNRASNSHSRCTALFNWLPYTRLADAFGSPCFRCKHMAHILCAVCVLSVILALLISPNISFTPSSLPASFFWAKQAWLICFKISFAFTLCVLTGWNKRHVHYNDAYRCGSVFVFLISMLNKLTSFYEICYEQQVTGGHSIIVSSIGTKTLPSGSC